MHSLALWSILITDDHLSYIIHLEKFRIQCRAGINEYHREVNEPYDYEARDDYIPLNMFSLWSDDRSRIPDLQGYTQEYR